MHLEKMAPEEMALQIWKNITIFIFSVQLLKKSKKYKLTNFGSSLTKVVVRVAWQSVVRCTHRHLMLRGLVICLV